ncbi:MAG: DUF3426 domain-containing protein [Desulfobacteraceae bacterium]|nr:DUF3426 domain-containing protein [Desulfobacteraceae bacterium]
MIITCDECSTRFNLDESILKAEGSKVRCSLCKHIFTAFPQIHSRPPASEPEEKIKSDLPEDAPPEEIDYNELDFEESDFEIDELDFKAEESSPNDNSIGLKMEESEADSADIEISFDTESDLPETQDTLDFDGDELTFDEVDIDFDEPKLEIKESQKSDDFDDIELESFDQDSQETTKDDLEADLSFEDDQDADLVFEESSPEQELALETKSSDEQNMTISDLSMETPDQETPDQETTDQEITDQEITDQEITDQKTIDQKTTTSETKPDLKLDEEPVAPPDHELNNLDSNKDTDHPENEPQIEEDIGEPEYNFSSYDQVLDQDTEPKEDSQEYEMTDDRPVEDDQPVEVEEPLPENQPAATGLEEGREKALIEKSTYPPELDTSPPRKRKKKSAMGRSVILILLLFILVASAYTYISTMPLDYKIPSFSDIKIPYLENILKKDTPEKLAPKPIPNEGSVNGRFVSNDTVGDLFIITGQIENPAAVPYSYIQVKGTLITKEKIKAKTQTVFCGNIISEEMLKTGNISDISKQLTIREGSHNSNVNIKPKGSVPFMLVFSNLPDNLENFTVEVVEF